MCDTREVAGTILLISRGLSSTVGSNPTRTAFSKKYLVRSTAGRLTLTQLIDVQIVNGVPKINVGSSFNVRTLPFGGNYQG